MNFSKSYLAGALIECCVHMPMTLKQQALRHIALKLCYNSSIKKQIFDPELESMDDLSPEQVRAQWEKSMKKELMRIIKTLFLPQVLQEQLFALIRSMALQLLMFSGHWKEVCNIPFNSTADLWLPTDWIENRLCVKKIAERTVKDDKFTLDQRYRVACLYCLEEFISPLWNQLSPEVREDFLYEDTNFCKIAVIDLWSIYLDEPGSFEDEEEFFYTLFRTALYEFRASVFVFAWQKLSESTIRRVATLLTGIKMECEKIMEIRKQVLPFKESLKIQLPYPSDQGDSICYFLMQLRELKFSGWEAMLKSCEPVVEFFLEWPQEDFF